MENVKYIPGDLVMTNGVPIGTQKGIVYQVTESNADKCAKVKDGKAFTELKGSVTLSNLKGKSIHDDGFLFCDSGAWVKDIVPIKLTSQKLEANGWKKNEYGVYYKSFNPHKAVCLTKGDGSNWCVSVGATTFIHCKFVHQLQHLLFGLGLDSSLKV